MDFPSSTLNSSILPSSTVNKMEKRGNERESTYYPKTLPLPLPFYLTNVKPKTTVSRIVMSFLFKNLAIIFHIFHIISM